MKKNFILMMLSACLISLFTLSACGGDKEQPKNDLTGKTFVAKVEGNVGKLYFNTISDFTETIEVRNLDDLGFYVNDSEVAEKIKAIIDKENFNLPFHFNYIYNEKNGEIKVTVPDNFSDKALGKLLPKVINVLSDGLYENLNDYGKSIMFENLRKELSGMLKKSLETMASSMVYKKDKEKIYMTGVNPSTQETETIVFVLKK